MASQRIKVLYTETYTHAAGGQRGLIDLVTHLDHSAFEPIILLQGPGKLRDAFEKLGVHIIQKRLEPFKNRWLPGSWLMGVGAVRKAIREVRPDIVHSNHLYVGRYSGRAAKAMGIPSLVTLRIVHQPEVFDRYNRLQTLAVHDRAVANSEAGRQVLSAYPDLYAKTQTIKNGMDLQRFRPLGAKSDFKVKMGGKYGLEAGSVVITQVASMVPQKGNEDLTRVFIDLAKKYPAIHLFLVGGAFMGTDNSRSILAMAKDAGLNHRIHLTDYVWDVAEFLNMTDISVLCSRDREGLPRSIIEAMACGNPVIGTDVGGMRELIGDGKNGYLVKAGDSLSLQRKLEALIADESLRREMGLAGLAMAQQHHDIRVMMARYQDLYRELAGRRNREDA